MTNQNAWGLPSINTSNNHNSHQDDNVNIPNHNPADSTPSTTTPSLVQIQAEQELEAQILRSQSNGNENNDYGVVMNDNFHEASYNEDEALSQALETSLLSSDAVPDAIPVPGTATAVKGCAFPMAAAYEIDSEDSEDERENKKKGILYAEVLAVAPMTQEEIDEETMKLVEQREKEEQALKIRLQKEEDASVALAMQLQLQDAEEERRRLLKIKQQARNQNNGNEKIQFVTAFEQDDYYEYDYDYDCDDDDNSYSEYNDDYNEDCKGNDDKGFRINSNSKHREGVESTSSEGWHRSYGSDLIVGANGELRTKHDVELKNKSNAHRLGVSEAAVSDKAYNNFRNKMKKKGSAGGSGGFKGGEGRSGNGSGGDASRMGEKTREGALDKAALLCIQRAINCGVLESMNGAVKEGKEAIVYHAHSAYKYKSIESCSTASDNGVAVKVFKRIEDFRNRGEYVDGDSRYFGQKFKSLDKRAQLELWTEKEFRNLMRAHASGVPTPRPIAYRENILFMSFLGDEGWPAPQLKEISSSNNIKKGSKRWKYIYCEVMVAIRRLYQCARLVHGDLSEYNLLLCATSNLSSFAKQSDEDKNSLTIALIDFGQAVELKHPQALDLLQRDLSRIEHFFRQRCGINVLTSEEALKYVVAPLLSLAKQKNKQNIEEDRAEERVDSDVVVDEQLVKEDSLESKSSKNDSSFEKFGSNIRKKNSVLVFDFDHEFSSVENLLSSSSKT